MALPARHSQSWQAREDAATIKGLQADLEAVIQARCDRYGVVDQGGGGTPLA